MDEHRVDSVERIVIGRRDDYWAVAMTASDGTRMMHVFPPETLNWRAAEYGIDPEDSQTLLDVVLHERHMHGHDHRSPDFLYNCGRDQARRAMHRRVADVKTRVRVVDPDGHLDQIHTSHVHVPDRHDEMVSFVDHVRRHGTAPHKEPGRG